MHIIRKKKWRITDYLSIYRNIQLIDHVDSRKKQNTSLKEKKKKTSFADANKSQSSQIKQVALPIERV